jgi:hypothetical protein
MGNGRMIVNGESRVEKEEAVMACVKVFHCTYCI